MCNNGFGGCSWIIILILILCCCGNGGFNKKESNAWIKLLDRLNISYVNWSLCNKAETASIIKSSCKKTSGWKKSDLTQSGKWLYQMLRKY